MSPSRAGKLLAWFLLILLLIVILTRRSNSYKVNAGAGKQGIVEENEFVYSRVGVPVVDQAANS